MRKSTPSWQRMPGARRIHLLQAQLPDGSKSPYEMNIVYFDALNDPAAGESLETQVNRFMVSQAIMLALRGRAGHLLPFAVRLAQRPRRPRSIAGINRRINRQKFTWAELERESGREAFPADLRVRKVSRSAQGPPESCGVQPSRGATRIRGRQPCLRHTSHREIQPGMGAMSAQCHERTSDGANQHGGRCLGEKLEGDAERTAISGFAGRNDFRHVAALRSQLAGGARAAAVGDRRGGMKADSDWFHSVNQPRSSLQFPALPVAC